MAAEEAFRQAHQLGRDPQPGLSLLRLAEGKVDAARNAIKSALADDSRDQLARAQLLPAQVEIALAAGDAATARVAAEELGAIASTFGTPAMDAVALCARGQLQLATGDEDRRGDGASAPAAVAGRSWTLRTRRHAPAWDSRPCTGHRVISRPPRSSWRPRAPPSNALGPWSTPRARRS